jgi:CheY-like chemotaxis protein
MSEQALPMVLLVEDEALMLLDVQQTLEDGGFLTIAAPNGTEALELLNSRSSEISAILTDIELGSKVSGWEVARRAREILPGVPVVYMSGARAKDWQAYGVPGSVMLAKPFAAAQVLTALSTLINNAAGANPEAPV